MKQAARTVWIGPERTPQREADKPCAEDDRGKNRVERGGVAAGVRCCGHATLLPIAPGPSIMASSSARMDSGVVPAGIQRWATTMHAF